MNERLLQFIWQFQYLNSNSLLLTNGAPLQVIFPGNFNTNQGPDFLEGRIRIDDMLLVGNIELHLRTSDWNRHSHQFDSRYANVILHVVWENDEPSLPVNLPTLVLQDRVPQMLLQRYTEFMNEPRFIPCAGQAHLIDMDQWNLWRSRLTDDRIKRKALLFQQKLQLCNHHWEEAFWWLCAAAFGGNINGDAFEEVARSIPYNVIGKIRTQPIHLEAILMGQGGLLNEDFTDDYMIMLKKEYGFLKKKYSLQPVYQQMQFLRMRPRNFPTLRLAQLAMLCHQSYQLFSIILEMQTASEAIDLFNVTANDYWHYHYMPDVYSGYVPKTIGERMSQNIVINAVIPSLAEYARHSGKKQVLERAISWLHQLKPEQNRVVKSFRLLGFNSNDAFDTQAMLELKKNWCDLRNCLQCQLGQSLLGKSSAVAATNEQA